MPVSRLRAAKAINTDVQGLLDKLIERRIWRVLVAYPSVTFIWLQVVEFFINNYDFDHRLLTVSLIGAVVFFPAAVVWNWKHGEAGAQAFSKPEVGTYIVFSAAAIVSGWWYWQSTPPVDNTFDRPAAATTLAVMPFENASNDPEVQFLCDGIAESLINWLATVPDVRVTSKSASFRLRDVAEDTARIAGELGVDAVVRGRLERIGDQVVISTSLVDTRDESQLWGERLVRPADEVIFLERSIVDAIKDGLSLEVSESQRRLSASGGTDDPQAYEHYLRGHYLIQSTNTEELYEGLEELRAATRIDPKYAQPFADIADVLAQMLYYGIVHDESLIDEARGAAYTAVGLAPELSEAHTALASILQFTVFDWEEVDAAYEAAVARDPQSPVTYNRFAEYLSFTFQTERAREMAARALAKDSLDSSAMHAVGLAELMAGNYAAAEKAFGDWNRFYPNNRWSYIKHSVALGLAGRCDESQQKASTVERMLDNDPPPLMDSWLAWSHQICGRDADYLRSVERVAAKRALAPDALDPGYAYIYALEGDTDALIAFLSRVVDERNPLTMIAKLFEGDFYDWPAKPSLLSDPRYADLVERAGFSPRG